MPATNEVCGITDQDFEPKVFGIDDIKVVTRLVPRRSGHSDFCPRTRPPSQRKPRD